MTTVKEWIEVLKRVGGLVKAAGRLLIKCHHDMWAPYDGSNGSAIKWVVFVLLTFNMSLFSFLQTWYWPTGQVRRDILVSKIDAVISDTHLDMQPEITVGGTPVFTSIQVIILSKDKFDVVKREFNNSFLKNGWYLAPKKKNIKSPKEFERDVYYSQNEYYGSVFKGQVIYIKEGEYLLRFSEYNEVVERADKLDYQRWK